MRSDRGSQIQAYLSTDVDRIMVAKPLTECNIVFSNVSSGHANVQHVVGDGVDAISRAHAEGIVLLILFCFCPPPDKMVCYHATAQTAHPATRRLFRLCGCFMRFFSDS